jgi:LysR family transcriptional regulator for bpeEF and oprC
VAYQSTERSGLLAPLPELEALGCFVAVVDAGGFTAAARRLGLRKATLSRRVAALEAQLRAPLLRRTTRVVQLTDDGLAYYEHAVRALAAARDAEAALARRTSAVSGLVRVAAIPFLAELMIDTVLVPFLIRYPEVRIEVEVGARVVDLVGEGFDLALRVGPLRQASHHMRRLGAAGAGYFAAPAYLARRGEPMRPADLDGHDLLALVGQATPSWAFVEANRTIVRQLRPRLLASNELVIRAACAGGGIVRLPSSRGEELANQGVLVQVLRSYTPAPAPVHVVMPDGHPSKATRLFIDALTRQLVGHPALVARRDP